MKKRFLAGLLAVVLVVGVLPAVALAETTEEEAVAGSETEGSGSVVLNTDGTVTIGETTYKLCLGQGTQKEDGSLVYWLDPVNRGIIPGETDPVNEFRFYLFLRDPRDPDNADASEAVYKQFWASCSITDVAVTVNGQSDTTGVTLGEIGTFSDGYHKYIPVSVSGERGGAVSVTLKHTNETSYTLTNRFLYTVASELTSETDTTSYSVSVENAVKNQSYFYYIDLGETRTVTVSGALSGDPVGRLVLAQTAEGTGESDLWQHFSGSEVKTFNQTVTTEKLLLRVVNNDGGSISGVVTVADVQSGDNTQSGGGNQPVVPEAPALPDGVSTANFYDSQTCDLNNRLTHAYLKCLQEGEGDYRAIYYVTANGFTAEERENVTVFADANINISDDLIASAWIERADGNYDLKILLSQLDYVDPPVVYRGFPYNVVVSQNGEPISAIQVGYQLNGTTQSIEGLTIGFAQISESGAVTVNLNVLGQGNYKYNGSYGYRTNATLVAAARNDEGGWTVNEDVTASLQVTEWKIVNINGDPETFSWSSGGYVDTLTDVSARSIPLYVKPGSVAQSMVEAKVTGTIGGETFTTTITGGLYVYFLAGGTFDCSEYDTVEELNAFLQALADSVDPDTVQGTIYKLKLADATYEGTIILPDEFQDYNILHLHGAERGKTVIKGGIDLNTARVEELKYIHFVADDRISSDDQLTRALYGSGIRTMANCSFYGYDIAVDSSDGVINAKGGNVFVNNEMAVLVDLIDAVPNDKMHNLSADEWFDNTFINNTTAVQILSLHEKVSQFYFRISNSNFINNGTDIDARCGGNLYMYRNYFGQYIEVEGIRPIPGKPGEGKHNGRDELRLDDLLDANTKKELDKILVYATATATVNDTTNVFTNPRWLFPVLGWWGFNIPFNDSSFSQTVTPADALMTLADEGGVEEDYVNVMVADWEDGTVILNEEADSLRLDASAFESEGEKQIGVLDEDEETLGTWNFD